jgi:hypothetical protein
VLRDDEDVAARRQHCIAWIDARPAKLKVPPLTEPLRGTSEDFGPLTNHRMFFANQIILRGLFGCEAGSLIRQRQLARTFEDLIQQ